MRHRGSPKIPPAALLLLTVMGSMLVFLSSPVFAVSPACGDNITISTTLSSDIGPCSTPWGLLISVNNIVLNCAGHTITGTGVNNSLGILLVSGQFTGVTGVTVKNCNVTGFAYGILLAHSSNNVIKGNTANHNVNDGFHTGGYGFVITDFANFNSFQGNTANDNDVAGFVVANSTHNSFQGNTANGNGMGGFAVVNLADNNVFKGNTANGNDVAGFAVIGSSTNSLNGNTANNNVDGFWVTPSEHPSINNVLKGNTADFNSAHGYNDATSGLGTAGTANMYRGDECSSNGAGGSTPTGLCRPQS